MSENLQKLRQELAQELAEEIDSVRYYIDESVEKVKDDLEAAFLSLETDMHDLADKIEEIEQELMKLQDFVQKLADRVGMTDAGS